MSLRAKVVKAMSHHDMILVGTGKAAGQYVTLSIQGLFNLYIDIDSLHALLEGSVSSIKVFQGVRVR